MTEAALPVPVVRAVRMVPGEHRTPRAIADVALGPLRLRYTVAGLKSRKLAIRAPLAADGAAGVTLPPEAEAALAAAVLAAVRASPEVLAGLLRRAR